MTEAWWENDDVLVEAVRCALEPVPQRFVDAGKASFSWHNIDAELAALIYDSAEEQHLVASGTRAEPAALRALTFDASGMTIELEIIDAVLHGQLVPPTLGTVEVRRADGASHSIEINDVGYFTVSPVPTGRFRLYCTPAEGEPVLTDWITV